MQVLAQALGDLLGMPGMGPVGASEELSHVLSHPSSALPRTVLAYARPRLEFVVRRASALGLGLAEEITADVARVRELCSPMIHDRACRNSRIHEHHEDTPIL